MIKTILVRATDDASGALAYAAALRVAQRFGAHIDALHVRLDAVEIAVAMSTEGAGGMLLQGMVDSLERDADTGEAKARAQFNTFCSDAGLALIAGPAISAERPSAMFHVETGQEARWMPTYGLTSDLAVVARGIAGKDAVARSTLEALLLESGRPLLIPAAAPAPDFATRIAIAWKATPQAARAVAFAMPFLTQASAITILSVDEEDGRRDDAARLVRYLGWHGITARAERLTPGSDGGAATLLTAAKDKGGLLVMGGYGHTRLREWVFGGFTQFVLDHADVLVLMAH
jgi:nucleotide-binding universal stress UspA family protein